MSDAVVCCIAKNEGPYILEWITYHLKLGFSHIYIYDNNDDSESLPNYLSKTELFKNEKTKNKIIIIPFPGKGRQVEAYNNFIMHQSHKHKWVAVLDCDEFIVLKTWEPITNFLSKVCKQGSLVLHWRIFGDSGRTNYSSEPVTERFTMCWKNLYGLVKSISLCADVNNYTNPHFSILKNGFQHDCSGRITSGPDDNSQERLKLIDFAYINHYFGKTYEEWLIKKNRGSADNTPKRQDNEFHAHNQNEVQDLSAHHFYTNPDLDFST
jgi:hypothetical protein